MVLHKIATLSLFSLLFIGGCNTLETPSVDLPQPIKPQIELELQPVEFKVIQHDDDIFYALDSKNYINLSINMLNIQTWIYQSAYWDKLNDGTSNIHQDDRTKKGKANSSE